MTTETASLEPAPGLGLLSRSGLALALIAATALLIYANIYDAPFVFDDIPQIVEKRAIRDLGNYASWQALRYPRVLVDFTFAINHRLGQLEVFGYHLFNVIIHVLNGFLAFFLSRAILKRLDIMSGKNRKEYAAPGAAQVALLAALLFVAHPIQTQAVTYTVQRYASMAALFYMAAVLVYLAARDRQQTEMTWRKSPALAVLYVLSGFCAILAFLSKQSAASLPLAILLVEYACYDRSWRGWKRKSLVLAPCLVAFLAFIFIAVGGFRGSEIQFGRLLEDVSRHTREAGALSRWDYLCTQFNVLVVYLRLLILPVGQNVDHLYLMKRGFFSGFTPLGFLFVLGLMITAVGQREKRPFLLVGVFWFFLTLSVESSLIPISDALFEHRLYLPMLGFSLVVACGLFRLLHDGNRRRLLLVGSTCLILALGTAAWARNRVWQSDLSLWSDSVSKNPRNHRAQVNLGVALMKRGRHKEALDHFSRALELFPGYGVAHADMAGALIALERFEEAEAHARRAIELDPRNAMAHINLGSALGRRLEYEEASWHYAEALRLHPGSVEARVSMGATLARRGRYQQAIDILEEALRRDPNDLRGHLNLAVTLEKLEKLERAEGHFRKVLEIDPEHRGAHQGLGFVLARLGRHSEAVEHLNFESEGARDEAPPTTAPAEAETPPGK